jgi:hypothetical protein
MSHDRVDVSFNSGTGVVVGTFKTLNAPSAVGNQGITVLLRVLLVHHSLMTKV